MKIINSSSIDFQPFLHKRLSSFGGLASPKHIEYFKCYFNYDFTDLSFGMAHPDGEILCLLTSHILDGIPNYTWYGQPVRLLCSGATNTQAIQLVQSHLNKILWKTTGFIDYQEFAIEMGFLSRTLLLKGVTPRVYSEQVIRLESDSSMLADMRKVFRQNINWGECNLTCNIIDASNVAVDDILRFEEFHIAVSGHRTRSHASWLAQMDLVLAGENFIISSHYKGALVGMSLFAASGLSAYYSVGVYERALFNYPLSHYPIWLGMKHARAIGCLEFNMGESYYSGVADSLNRFPSEKECNISYFKRGFGGSIRTSVRFRGMY